MADLDPSDADPDDNSGDDGWAGWGGDSDGEWSGDSDGEWGGESDGDGPRTKRIALGALVVVVVVVALAIVLVSLLVDTSSPPATPRATAQRWADDLVHGDDDDRHGLECADSGSGGILRLIVVAPTGAHAGPAERRGPDRWDVPLTFDEAGGGTSGADVTVVRRNGAYLVC